MTGCGFFSSELVSAVNPNSFAMRPGHLVVHCYGCNEKMDMKAGNGGPSATRRCGVVKIGI